MIFICGTWD